MLAVLTPDVSNQHIMNPSAIRVVQAHKYMRSMDDITIIPKNVIVLICAGFRSQFKATAPVAPNRAASDADMVLVFLVPALNALNDHAVIKISQEAVGNTDITAVEGVDSIGIIAPHTDRFRPVHTDPVAIGEDIGECSAVTGDDSVNFAVLAGIKVETSV